jgi:hypothetical protein
MAYENISLLRQNVTMIDGYFYMMDQSQDAMIVKTDDGTQAYSYPLDTTIDNQVVSLEYDGRNFWTLENPGSDTIKIKRWNIENYVLKLRNDFTKIPDASHKYQSEAMAIEHYHLRVHSNTSAGASIVPMYIPKTKQADLNLIDKLENSMVLSLGPNENGQREDISVNTVTLAAAGSTYDVYDVALNSSTTYAYKGPTASGVGLDYQTRYGDAASFHKNIWIFNNWDGVSGADGALYKLNSLNGTYITRYAGGEYKNVKASTFYAVPNYIFDRDWQATPANDAFNWPKFNSIAYARTTNIIFLNPDNLTTSYGSMTMDNVEDDQATVIPLYDMTMEGVNVYRLQRKATYYGATYTFADNTYNYQLSTLEPFITSISLRANPAILPANGVNVSQITAIVKDQHNLPIEGKLVYFTDDDPNGSITGSNPANTDADGVATTTYTAGTSAREVKITATAQQGGVETPSD